MGDWGDVIRATKPESRNHEVMQSAGPQTSMRDTSYFDMHDMPEKVLGTDPKTSLGIQALVNHAEDEGWSMLMVHHPPGDFTRPHSHNVPQIVYIIEGEVSQGSRTYKAGEGFYTPVGVKYSLKAGPEGCRRVEWRPSPLRFATDWVGGADGVGV